MPSLQAFAAYPLHACTCRDHSREAMSFAQSCYCLVNGSQKKIKVEGRRHRDRHQKERKRGKEDAGTDLVSSSKHACSFLCSSPHHLTASFSSRLCFAPCQGLVTISSPSRGSFRMRCFALLLLEELLLLLHSDGDWRRRPGGKKLQDDACYCFYA